MNFQLKFKDLFTVPNLLTYLRLILIPFIIWAYCSLENGLLTFIFVLLSGLSDVLDGKIARRFNMVTDLGKALDPVADKLTQAAMLACLLSKYQLMWAALAVFIVKEIFMVVTAFIEAKFIKQINGALWYGKACTSILYVSMLILLFFPHLPLLAANIIIIISIAAMIIAAVLYGIYRFKNIKAAKQNK